MRIFFTYLLLSLGVFFSALLMANELDDCNPVVKFGAQTKTLQQTLSLLAKQHNFELSFSMDADKPVESIDGMRLSQALKYLTADVNTVFQHKKIEGCARARIVSVEVLPVGEQGEIIHMKSKSVADIGPLVQTQAKVEPVHIDNMELYIEDVLLKKRKREKNLSREQRKEFMKMSRQVRVRLEAEGLLEPRVQKSKRSKNESRKSRSESK